MRSTSDVIGPEEMKSFLQNGVKKFKALPRSTQLGRSRQEDDGAKSSYPKDGLVLSVTLRKLYSRQPRTARERIGIVEWNLDVWFRKDEACQFLPSKPKKGDEYTVPQRLIERSDSERRKHRFSLLIKVIARVAFAPLLQRV